MKDKDNVLQSRVLENEAVEALQTLRLYEEQRDGGDSEFISRLGWQKRAMKQ